MSYIKTPDEIAIIKEGGRILGEILEELAKMVRPGANGRDLDLKAKELIRKAGGAPAFLNYRSRTSEPPYPSAVCFSINEELVHGIAREDKIVKEEDIVSLDIGMRWPLSLDTRHISRDTKKTGYFTDTALTVAVGNVPEKTKQLLDVTKKALEIGIAKAVVGNTIADIGRAIQDYVEPQGYGIVRDLVGHGVGHAVHEDPRVPNVYEQELEQWKLEPGVVIAIEPMITMGSYHVNVADDGWTISTADSSLCAHFEHTVVVTEHGPMVVTRRPNE